MTPRKWKVLNKFKVQSSKFPGLTPQNGATKIDEIVNILLENRGIKTKTKRGKFLNPRPEDVSIKTVGIDNSAIKKTIKRIKRAIDTNEKIIIYGDYDVDGICGTAILWETLFAFYKNVVPYIPHRVDEGYGLSSKGISNLKSKISNIKLIITVDNGIVAHEALRFARKNKIDVIITDHHVRSKKIPKAYSVVHTTKLCGTGIAYLLSKEIQDPKFKVQNVQNENLRTNNQGPEDHLELVALATVADLVPLVGANRILVKFGIENLRKTKRVGLLSLFSEAMIQKEDIEIYHIGYIIAPRLNATGRIAHAMDSLRLICTKDPIRARKLARYLSETNKNRQVMTGESTMHANLISQQIDISQNFIFVHDKNYNQGVIGLIASRLVEKHYRPAIAVSIGERFSKGSARSIPGFNIIEFLRSFNSYLLDAGGHPMAAGFTIETSRIEEFRTALVKSSNKLITSDLLERVLKIDLELDFNEIDADLYSAIKNLAPFGMGNPEPLFVSRGVTIEDLRFVGREKQHLKFVLSKDGRRFEAILFGANQTELKIGDKVDAVYVIEKDEWNGNSKILLKIRDIKRFD